MNTQRNVNKTGKEMQNEIDRYENYNLLIFTETTTTNRVS